MCWTVAIARGTIQRPIEMVPSETISPYERSEREWYAFDRNGGDIAYVRRRR